MAVDNNMPEVIRGVSLRWRGGGPTFVYPLAVAPGTKQTVAVKLAALSQNQVYDVRLLADTGECARQLGQLQANISWPQELVNVSMFRDMRYQTLAYQETDWSASQKQSIFVALAVGAVALAGMLLLRRALFRVAAIVLITAGVTVACTAIMRSWPLVTVQDTSLVRPNTPAQPLRIVTSRRTTQWQTSDPLAPLYPTKLDMEQDNCRILVDQLNVHVRPGEVRLFQVGGR